MGVVVPFLRLKMSNHQRILGKVLEEALGLCAVDEEVQRLRDAREREKGEDGPH